MSFSEYLRYLVEGFDLSSILDKWSLLLINLLVTLILCFIAWKTMKRTWREQKEAMLRYFEGRETEMYETLERNVIRELVNGQQNLISSNDVEPLQENLYEKVEEEEEEVDNCDDHQSDVASCSTTTLNLAESVEEVQSSLQAGYPNCCPNCGYSEQEEDICFPEENPYLEKFLNDQRDFEVNEEDIVGASEPQYYRTCFKRRATLASFTPCFSNRISNDEEPLEINNPIDEIADDFMEQESSVYNIKQLFTARGKEPSDGKTEVRCKRCSSSHSFQTCFTSAVLESPEDDDVDNDNDDDIENMEVSSFDSQEFFNDFCKNKWCVPIMKKRRNTADQNLKNKKNESETPEIKIHPATANPNFTIMNS